MRLLFFGTYDARQHPRVRVVREGLLARGWEVSECNVPLDLDTSARVRLLRQPWRVPRAAASFAGKWRRLRREARQYRDVDAVLVPYLGHFDVHLARRTWRRTPLALDYFISGRDTAVDRGVTSRPLLWLLDRVDRAALRAADVSFVDTEGQIQLVPEAIRNRTVVVPIGAPDEWFRPPHAPPPGPLRILFFGSYTPLQAAPVIAEAIDLLGGEPVRFTMVGRGQDLDLTRKLAGSRSSVAWHDWVEPEDLPALAEDHDVCLGIFGTSAKAMRVVPNKLYQGAASGCAIVTSDTPSQRAALGGAGVFVPPGNPEALGEALRALASDPDRVWSLRKAAHARAEEAFRPAAVVAALDLRLRETAGRP
jgi:glycosyltransferase involved in cell wall biosynthesis